MSVEGDKISIPFVIEPEITGSAEGTDDSQLRQEVDELKELVRALQAKMEQMEEAPPPPPPPEPEPEPEPEPYPYQIPTTTQTSNTTYLDVQ